MDTSGEAQSPAPVKQADSPAQTLARASAKTPDQPAVTETSSNRPAAASKKKTVTGESAAATAISGASAAAAIAAEALDSDFRYRLARKNVHIAFANLGQAFQRMMTRTESAAKVRT